MKKQSPEDLYLNGVDCLEAGDTDGALDIGRQLYKLKHPAAFEILACAHIDNGDLEAARAILEEGVDMGEELWPLWRLLGNVRAQLGNHKGAHKALQQALCCQNSDESSIYLQIAVTYTAEERFDEALETIERIGPDHRLQAESLRMHIYNKREQYDKTIQLGEKLMGQFTIDQEIGDVESAILVDLGKAYWKGKDDEDYAFELALEACIPGAEGIPAFELIRNLDNETSTNACLFTLEYEGIWHEPDEDGNPLGFVIIYAVLADNLEEAMDYPPAFEPEEVLESMQLARHEINEAPKGETVCKGVYQCSPHMLFDPNIDDPNNHDHH